MKKSYCFLLMIILFLNTSIVMGIDTTENLRYEYHFDYPHIEKIEINGIIYNEITILGLSTLSQPGAPCLPVKGSYILLPYNSHIQSITVQTSDPIHIESEYMIKPGSRPVPLSQKEFAQAPTPDSLIYSSDELYPGDLFSEIGTYTCKGFEILVLMLNPIQYKPDTKEIIYYPVIEVTVEHTKEKNNHGLLRGLIKDVTQMKNKIDNPDILTTYPQLIKTSTKDSYDLLILTTEELKEGFVKLKTEHEKRGIKTKIVTLQDMALFSMDITSEDIREFIKQEYQQNGIEYVLLGGDADIVPAKMLYVYGLDEEKWPYETFLPSDLYYACLDGSYNSDGDDRWGEPTDGENGDDVDLYAEVYVGRASVDNLDDVEHFVNKTIAYLSISDQTDYINNFLLAGEYLGDYGVASWGGNYLDLLIDTASNDGYTTKGIPSDKFHIEKMYDREQEWDAEDMIASMNEGIHIINHDGHSYYGYNMKMVNSDVFSLTNDDYFFAYSVGCMAGGFDDPQGYDCFAEYLNVKTNHGAFAAIMNARYGWFWSFSTDGDGTRYTREFWDAVFGEKTPIISKANQDSKEDNIFLLGRSCMRWTYYQLNLFGDPTLSLHISTPPDKPDTPNGPTTGESKTSYTYSTVTDDTDGDQVFYLFDWGDNTQSEWFGPYQSGEVIQASHIWNKKGDYQIRVKAKDEHGVESEWSDILPISLPKFKTFQFLFIQKLIEKFPLLQLFFIY
jgi:hypothetical protein